LNFGAEQLILYINNLLIKWLESVKYNGVS
jgi:hypothetical protein